MATSTVKVNIIGDATRLQQALGQGASASDQFKARLKLLAQAAVAALAFKALSAVKEFVGGSVRAFSDLTESTNAVESTFGDAADAVLAIGENSAESFGLARSEFNSAAVSFAGFAKNIAGDGGDVAGVIETLIERASDFASVQNLEVNEAMGVFQSTLAGQTEPIRRFGLDLSAAAVEAHALAAGIHDGTGEMSEGEKQLGRYSLLLQETEQWAGDFAATSDDLANRERIVNAELEDSKALFGEIIAPMKAASLEMQGGFIQSLNDAAIALAGMTGALSDGEAALLSFKNETGGSAGSVADVIEGVDLAWQSWTHEIDVWADRLFNAGRHLDDVTEGVRALIEEGDLGTEGIAALRQEVENMGRAGELTTEEVDALTTAIDEQEQVMLTDIYRDHEIQLYKNRDAQREVGGATADTTDEMVKQADELRAQTDPLFAAIRHAENLEEAQNNLNDSIVTYGEDSREARAAAADVASENAALIGVLQQLKADGIDPTGSAARTMLEGMGIPPGTIASLFSEFDRIEQNLEGRAFDVHLSVPSFEMQQRANKITPHKTGETRLQRGGIVTEGLLDGNQSRRREAVVPLETQEGKRALAKAIAEALGMIDTNGAARPADVLSGATFNLVGPPRQMAEEIADAVAWRARTTGV